MKFPQQVLKLLNLKKWERSDWVWPALQAHRGHWVTGDRENTLAALKKARELGFEMAEIDVRLSKDGVPVLAHDKDLKRLCGEDYLVKNLTAKELKQWDFPTLEEVFQSPYRPKFLNIEIKKDYREGPELERRVIEVINKENQSDRIVVSSFNPKSLKVFRDEAPEIIRGLLIDTDFKVQISYWRLLGNFIAEADLIHWPHQLLNEWIVKTLKNAGLPVVTWTVNDYRIAKQLCDWGVDSIITDRIKPDIFEGYLNS